MAHGASVLLYGLIDRVAKSSAASGGSALVAITARCFIACHPGGVGMGPHIWRVAPWPRLSSPALGIDLQLHPV